RFNEAKVPPISTKRNSQAWHSSYVLKILHNPAVIGHSQPHRIVDGQRVPEGEIIPNYFPRVISDALYYKVREMRASKRNPSGRKGTSGGNLFTGLVRCGTCKGAMHKVNKGKGPKGGTYLVCSNALRGNGCRYRAVRLGWFEQNVLLSIWDK